MVREGTSCRMMGSEVEIGDRPKMRMDAGLHRLVVIGHDRKHRVGAGGLCAPGQLDGLAGRVRAGAGNDPDAAAGDLDGGADDAVVLGRRQRRGFAGGFTDHDAETPARSGARTALRTR